MRAIRNDPKLVRWLVGVLLGIPVAVVIGAAFPDRQGSQFVPFVMTALVAFTIVWLVAIAVERWLTGRAQAAERDRRSR